MRCYVSLKREGKEWLKTVAKTAKSKISNANKRFIKDVLERAVKTFAEMMIADISVGQGFEDIDWTRTFSVAGLATLISVLASIASYKVGDEGTASLVETN